ncbi:MAG: hypothetical protein WA395_08925 [Nitrososphaeraceae archaeon]
MPKSSDSMSAERWDSSKIGQKHANRLNTFVKHQDFICFLGITSVAAIDSRKALQNR